MTRVGWLMFRAASRLIPAEWRESVIRDLEDEAADAGRGGWWCAWQAVQTAARLRPAVTGDSAMTELRHAVRSLLRARWFSVGAIATFALGIGVNVAVFSAVDRALFRPLPYSRPDELVIMGEYGAGAARPYGTLPMSYVAGARSLDGVVDASQSGFQMISATLSEEPGDDSAVRLSESSYNTLSVLGVKPFAGRDFSEADSRARHRVALLSYEAWQGRFAGRADVVGSRLWSERQPLEIVGILPPRFINASNSLDPRADGLVMDFVDFSAVRPGARGVPPILRLKPGVSVAVAQAQVDAMVARIRAAEPPSAVRRIATEIRVVPVRQVLFSGYASYLWLVTASAALVFLIATANLASLMLVRGRSRAQEHAVRASLGATRRRLMLAGIAEALVLALAGSVVALIVLGLTNSALQQVLPPVFSRYSAGLADGRVLAAVLLFATLGALIAGIVPGWRSGRVDVLAVLQQGGRGASRRAGGRSLLVVETAIGVLFVAGAVATSRNLISLKQTDLGFRPEGLYSVQVYLPAPATPDPAATFAEYSRVAKVVADLPDIRAFGTVNISPLWGSRSEAMTKDLGTQGLRYRIGAGYLETIGARIVAGRMMTADEVNSGVHVGVLSEGGLRLAFPGETARSVLGRSLVSAGEEPFQIVGVVADLRSGRTTDPDPLLYVPLDETKFRYLEFNVRTADDRKPSIVEIRERVKAVGLIPTTVNVIDISDQLDRELLNFRFRAVLFGSFALVALVLAVVGLYAVSSFEVAQRRREMGVRLALGAVPRVLAQGVIRDAIRPVLIGVAAGVVGAFWAAKFLQAFLTGVDARDPWTLLLVSVLLIGVAVAASWIPARRAAATDPAEALRAQ